ncbi:MAG: hypothetical protein SO183_10625 [Fusobacterium mortiferum]|nr:hypothetical protein [Fusobacterium mortiferum]
MILNGKYKIKGNGNQLKDGDTIEFIEGFSTCSGFCSACEVLKKIKTQEDLKNNFPDIEIEKMEE